MNGLPIINMSQFFNKELFLYSIGDLSLPRPVSLKKAGYLIVGLIIWSVPLILIFGLIMNPYYMILLVGPPVALAVFGDKPVFDGRDLFAFTKVFFKYIFRHKCFTNFKRSNVSKNEKFYIRKQVWVSRRRELQALADGWEA